MKTIMLSKEIMKENIDMDVTVFDIVNKAIEYNWESLAFSDNSEVFARIKANGYIFELVTSGEVQIWTNQDSDENYKDKYSNNNIEEIRSLIKSNKLYSDECLICNNNWFAITYGPESENDGLE